MSEAATSHANSAFPCVVQVGFAGARNLFPQQPDHPALYDQLRGFLTRQLEQLPTELGLKPSHFLCGISQIAIGSDTAFLHACIAKGILQRIFLSQPLDEYLSAKGSPASPPDFTENQAAEAKRLAHLPHIIEVRAVSSSDDRTQRFQETSMEILRASDVMIAVVAEGAVLKPGGTLELLDQAEKRRIPALKIVATVENGQPAFRAEWLNKEQFRIPELPSEIVPGTPAKNGDLPDSKLYLDALKAHCGTLAKTKKNGFVFAGVIIILLHFLATSLASFALLAHSEDWPIGLYIGLLVVEIVCLGLGMYTHRHFHHSRPGRTWALARLTSEITRSLNAIGKYHLHLRHLFLVAYPHYFLPLFRTIDVLHLRSTRANTGGPWIEDRDHYVTHRLISPDHEQGQLHWYRREVSRLNSWSGFFRRAFWVCTVSATLFTLFKLICVSAHILHEPKVLLPLLGVFAILLPVAAVGFISWSIAMGYETREHGYHDTQHYLGGKHLDDLRNALTRGEFEKLLTETETRLLGETVNWFYRQSFAEVV